VLQQAFIQSWIALFRGANVHEARSWLYRIVHNVAVNAVRGPAEAHGELTQAVQDRAGLAGVSNIERTIAVRDALAEVAALPVMQRQALFLTAVDGQSHDEVASVLGVSEGAGHVDCFACRLFAADRRLGRSVLDKRLGRDAADLNRRCRRSDRRQRRSQRQRRQRQPQPVLLPHEPHV
jgi:DNA-directed RNA polymerase specialized sigma24 family protein